MHGLTIKELADASGVKYNTLLQVNIGKTPGEKSETVAKVDAFMAAYEANADPNANVALRPFEEVNLLCNPAKAATSDPCNRSEPSESSESDIQ